MRLLTLLLALVLSGCQRTLWSQPPSAGTGCDRGLVGHWQSVRADGTPDGEAEAMVGADCRLVIVEHRRDGPREWPPVQLASARIGRTDVVWLDAAAANDAFEVETGVIDRDGTVYVFAYRQSGDRLDLWPPDHARLARQVIEGRLDGAVLTQSRDLTVRLDGDADVLAKLLDDRRTFQRRSPMRLLRVGDAGGPSSPSDQ